MPTIFKQGSAITSGPYAGGYNWNSAANWVGGVIPGDNSQLVLPNGPYTSVDDIPSIFVGTLQIGNNVTLIIAPGDSTIQNINSMGTGSLFQSDGFADLQEAVGGAYAVTSTGSLQIDGINGAFTLKITGGSAEFTTNANLASGSSFNFGNTSAGTLTIQSPNDFQNGWAFPVTNFVVLDKIVLGSSALFSAGTYTSAYNASAHTLTIPKAGGGNYVFTNFSLGTTPYRSFVATANSVELVCFAEGTRIATARGDVAVEDLRPGDVARTFARGPRPIVWIGHRRVVCRQHPRPVEMWPVRIAAGAFGEGLPFRDLRVSPEHAIYVDNRLIAARDLVNGTSIAQERVDAITYYHVELSSHDVLLAEGLPVESWLDAGNRSAFDNAAVVALHPDFDGSAERAWRELAYAPLIDDGPVLEAVRERLTSRAAVIGFDAEVDRTITVDTLGAHFFTLSPKTQIIRLVSSRHAPAGDRRTLGVALGLIAVDGIPLALDDPRLAIGFHVIERHRNAEWRWTDGNAVLNLGDTRSARTLELDVVAVPQERLALRA